MGWGKSLFYQPWLWEKNKMLQAYKKQKQMKYSSGSIQFPIAIKLDDGRHRYFKKYNVIYDRLTGDPR